MDKETDNIGLYLDNTFVTDTIYTMSPLAVYCYVVIGGYSIRSKYPSVKDIAVRIGRPLEHVTNAIIELRTRELLNDHDLKALQYKEENRIK